MGVSIGTYTGDGSDRDIYTGLSASGRLNEPDMVWVKNRIRIKIGQSGLL